MNTNTRHARRPLPGRTPRAAVVLAAALLLVLLTAPDTPAQTQLTEEASRQLRAQAEESSRAFVEGNYERLADLTYPKVVELMGGREKLVDVVRKDMAEMKAEGFETLSFAPGAEPTQVLREGRETYAVLPTKMRVRTPVGVYVSDSFLIAVSADDGKNWRFLGGASTDVSQLKLLLPEVAEKLKLPTVRNYPEDEKKP